MYVLFTVDLLTPLRWCSKLLVALLSYRDCIIKWVRQQLLLFTIAHQVHAKEGKAMFFS